MAKSIRGNFSATQVRGSDRQGDSSVIQMTGGTVTPGNQPTWDSAGNLIDSGSPTGGAALPSERTITANDSVSGTDYTVFCDATSSNLTLMFPASPVAGRILNSKKIDTSSHAVTLNGNGKNIEGSATVVISLPNLSLQTQYDGTQWRVI